MALGLENCMPRCHHTSGRNTFRPYGNEDFTFVKTGNTLACRVVLMIILCCFMNLRWVLEHPSGSFMELLPRYQELWSLVTAPRQKRQLICLLCLDVFPIIPFFGKTPCLKTLQFSWVRQLSSQLPSAHVFSQAWYGRFWMRIFKPICPKPHIIYSNDESLVQKVVSKAGYMSRAAQQLCPVRTTTTYVDGNGVKRAVGKRKEMRESQYPERI